MSLKTTGEYGVFDVHQHTGALTCDVTGKIRHHSENVAKKARTRFYKSRRFGERQRTLVLFHCEHCHGWHLGTARRR